MVTECEHGIPVDPRWRCGACEFDKLEAEKAFKPKGSALNVQVGGDHYKDAAIQPTEYIMANGIPFAEGNVIKYVTRWRKKGGVSDLKKARHYLDMLIEFEEKSVG